jgi:hypothetical protein
MTFTITILFYSKFIGEKSKLLPVVIPFNPSRTEAQDRAEGLEAEPGEYKLIESVFPLRAITELF